MAAQEERVREAQEAQATGSAQLSQEVRALRSAVGDKETALAAIKVCPALVCGRTSPAKHET